MNLFRLLPTGVSLAVLSGTLAACAPSGLVSGPPFVSPPEVTEGAHEIDSRSPEPKRDPGTRKSEDDPEPVTDGQPGERRPPSKKSPRPSQTPSKDAPAEDVPDPVTPEPRPWRTPRVVSPAAPRLDNRYPSNYCKIFWAPPGTSVSIERIDVGDSVFTPPDAGTDGTPIPEDVPILPMSVVGDLCPEGGDDGGSSAVMGKVRCEAGGTISDTQGCGLWPAHDGRTRIGSYRVTLTWHLSTLCTDDSTAPCRGLPVEPRADRPVVAKWRLSEPVCATTVTDEPGRTGYNMGC